MNSRTTRLFRELLAKLPEHVRTQAHAAYRIFLNNSAQVCISKKLLTIQLLIPPVLESAIEHSANLMAIRSFGFGLVLTPITIAC